jgi:hypothetical protein
MAKKKKVSPLAKALLETAGDMHVVGLIDRANHAKITLRHLRPAGRPTATPLTGEQIPFTIEKSAAGGQFLRRRLIPRRSTSSGRADENSSEF